MPNARTPDDLVTVSEGAFIARISPFTLYRWVSSGKVQGYGHRGCIRVSLSELMPPIVKNPQRLAKTEK